MGIFFNIFFFIAGVALTYVGVHLRVKERNKELVGNIQKLESDKKNMLSRFMNEIEKSKKEHASAIKEKKFQYEDKRMEFSKYFALLSSFHEKANILCSDKIDSILKKVLSDDQRSKKKAIEKYSSDIQKLVSELKDNQNRVKAQQNNMRLIASVEVDSLLDELNAAVESATEASRKMLAKIKTTEFLNNQSIIRAHQNNLFSHGKVIQNAHAVLKDQMKLELNEV